MKLRTVSVIFLSFLAIALIGCRSNPIYSVEEAPVTVASKKYNLNDVRAAILRAGSSLGWGMRETSPNRIVGTIYVREHMAQVDIAFNRNAYSIRYLDSQNLDYDGTNIHNNYNNWVQNLDRAIKTQLSSI